MAGTVFDSGTLGANYGRVNPGSADASAQHAAWVDGSFVYCLGLQGIETLHPYEALRSATLRGSGTNAFALVDGDRFDISVNGVEYDFVMSPSSFANIDSATPREIARLMNSRFLAARDEALDSTTVRPPFVAFVYGQSPNDRLAVACQGEGDSAVSLRVLPTTTANFLSEVGLSVGSAEEVVSYGFGLSIGDQSQVWQDIDLTSANLLRVALRARLNEDAPDGTAWEFSIVLGTLLDGNTTTTQVFARKQFVAKGSRTSIDLAANVSKVTGVKRVFFCLRLAERNDRRWQLEA